MPTLRQLAGLLGVLGDPRRETRIGDVEAALITSVGHGKSDVIVVSLGLDRGSNDDLAWDESLRVKRHD
jgi:predicted ABC-type transport system involved in lysophospholipase L1 biosynthesis ATPase subunit